MIRFCLALASVAFWPALPAWPWLIVVILAALICHRSDRLKVCSSPLWGIACGLAGGYWLLTHALPERWQGVDLWAEGTVIGLPVRQSERCRFDLALDQLTPVDSHLLQWAPRRQPRTIRLSWYQCQKTPQPGQRWRLQVRLKQPHGYQNFQGFDYRIYLLSQGIDASGYVRTQQVEPLSDHPWRGYIDRWRQQLSQQLVRLLGDSETVGLWQALLLGDKRQLSERHWQRLRDSGTAHLFVISGLHIGMLAGFGYALVVGLGRLLPQCRFAQRQRLAVIAAILASGGYAMLAGFSLPTQRAWVMVTAMLLGLLGWRSMSATQRLLLAAVVVLLIEPLAVRQAGFWLSFGACGVLILLFSGRLQRPNWITGLLGAQWAMLLGLTPWLLYYFYQWSPAATLINLVAVPLVTLLLPLALLGMLMLQCWPSIGVVVMELLDHGLAWGWDQLGLLPAHWLWPLQAPLSLSMLLLALLGSLLLLLPRSLSWRWLGMVLWLPLLMARSEPPEPGGYRVTMIDVGQGLALLVETAEHRLLYDTGPRYRSGFSAAKAAIVPYLHSQGIRQLDKLVISHADNDHAGGVEKVREQLTVDQLWSGSTALPADHYCRAGQRWNWEGVEFRVLYPFAGPGRGKANENNRSCVLLIDNGFERTLLTGDIEAPIERWLVEHYGSDLQAQWLVLAHHGSRSSSTIEFIAQVDPDQALVSSGWRNRFGHPHRQVLNRLERQGVAVYNSGDDGAVQWSVDAAGATQLRRAVDLSWGFW